MAKLSETYQAGSTDNLSIEQLYLIILDMYKDLAVAMNRKPDVVKRESDGLTTDVLLAIGTLNLNTTTQKVEMLTAHPTTTTVTWTTLG